MPFNGADYPQNCPFSRVNWSIGPTTNAWFHPSHPPNGISIGSACFAEITIHERHQQTDTQNDHAIWSVAAARILCSARDAA